MPFQRLANYSNLDDPALKSFRESCRQGDLPRVKELLPHCDQSGSLSLGLRDAATNNQIEIMQYLLSNNAIIDRYVVEEARSPAAFKLLFDHGLDIHETDLLRNVPLMFVVQHNDEALLGWFLDQGADPNFGPDPDTAKSSKLGIHDSGAVLETAIMYSTHAIVDILLERGATLENSLAFHAAVYREDGGMIDMMEHLLLHGADINKFGRHILPSHFGGTALHVAGSMGYREVVQWLLDHGADPTITDTHGMSPHLLAELYFRDEVREILLDAWLKKKGFKDLHEFERHLADVDNS